MAQAITSLEDFLDAYSGRDFGRKREVLGAVKEAAGDNGIDRLSDLANRIAGPGGTVDFTETGLTLVDAIDDVVFEATDESGDRRYRAVLQRFLSELDLVPDARESAKNTKRSGGREERAGSARKLQTQRQDDEALTQGTSTVAERETEGPIDDVGSDPIVTHHRGTDEASIASGELMILPRILPPPPAGEDGALHGAWLDGAAWHPLSMGVKPVIPEGTSMDDVVEMQSEFYAVPAAALKTYAARRPSDVEQSAADARELHRCGIDLGHYGVTYERAASGLSEAYLAHLSRYFPEGAAFLRRVGVGISCPPALADATASALDIEAHFIETGPDGQEQGSAPDARGAIGARARLDRPWVLERAMQLHLDSGVPLARGLVEGLVELRHAQAVRAHGDGITTDRFDRLFSEDWLRELSDYTVDVESPTPA